MHLHIQQIKQGNQDIIQMPLADWQKFEKRYQKMAEKISFEKRIENSLREIKDIKEGKKKATTMKDFLDEL